MQVVTAIRCGVVANEDEIEREVVSEGDRHPVPLALELGEHHGFPDLTFSGRYTHGRQRTDGVDQNSRNSSAWSQRTSLGLRMGASLAASMVATALRQRVAS